MIRVKKVDYLSDYKLALTFTDNKTKIVDLKKYKNKGPETVFYPFRDLEFFKSVRVDKHTGTIVWPNGVDLCPDALYMMGKDIQEKEKPLSKKTQSKPSIHSITSKSSIAAKSKH
jgi:hypothetical protein